MEKTENEKIEELTGLIRVARSFHEVAVRERNLEIARVEELRTVLDNLVSAVNLDFASSFCSASASGYCAENERCKTCLYDRACQAVDIAEKVLRKYEKAIGKGA